MIRLFSTVVIIAGLLLFVGNFSGLYPTIPWLGTIICIFGGFAYANAERWDSIPPDSHE